MSEESKAKAQKAYALAYDYEKKLGACSQCTIKALQEVYDELDSKAFQALGGFAAGGGCECDGICGAYAAGIYFFGTKTGRSLEDIGSDPEDPAGKRKHRMQFKLVKKLHDRFVEKYGNVNCSSIQKKIYGRSFYLADRNDYKEFEKAGGHDWGCTGVCGDAARWVVEIYEDFIEKGTV